MRRATVLKLLAATKANTNDPPASCNVKEPTDNCYPKENGVHSHVNGQVVDSNKVAATNGVLNTIHELKDEPAEQLDAWDPMAEDFHSAKNTLVLDPDKEPECVVTGKMSEEVLTVGKYQVCDFYLRYGSCADGIYCDRLHIDPSSRDKLSKFQLAYNSNRDRTCLNYRYLSPQELEPNPAVTILVSVTLAKTPSNFYFVAPYESVNFADFVQEDISFYVERVRQSSTFKTKLQKCHEQLAYLFNHNYRRDNVEDLIYRGQIVACKLKDGRFCRAEVLEEENFAKDVYLFKLFLLDVGIEVELPREAIYDIRVRSLSAPPMAINARLNLRPPANELNWSREALKCFHDQVQGDKYMLCRVQYFDERERMYTVDLLDLEDRSSLTEKMVVSGLAQEA